MSHKVSPHTAHPGRYKDCKHPDCLAYREWYRKRWTYDKAQGRARMTDTTPVVRHLLTLTGAGWTARAIAGAANTSASVVIRIRDGHQPRMRIDTAQRILAIDPTGLPSRPSTQTTEPFVPRIGSTRRVQAMLFMGWGHKQMREHCGLRTAAIVHQQGRWVTRSTHDAIARMYDELSMRQGPSKKAATYARQRGYASPLAWDDIDKDAAPSWVPADYLGQAPTTPGPRTGELDEVAVLRRVEGDHTVPLTTADRLEVVRRLHARGLTDRAIQRLTGIWADQAGRDRKRLGLPSNYEEAS